MPILEKVADGAQRFKADWSFDLRVADAWSVHVHVIPPGQMVPLHHHPENEELTLSVAGVGEWTTVWDKGGPGSETSSLAPGMFAHSPPGAAHQVRNRGEETLVTAVVQRPEFGQNWYLLAEDVTASERSTVVSPGGAFESVFSGWEVAWEGPDPDPKTLDGERLGFVVSGEGSLDFEDRKVPLEGGYFFKVPSGLPHRISGDPRLLSVRIRMP